MSGADPESRFTYDAVPVLYVAKTCTLVPALAVMAAFKINRRFV
jgi:hypothetical protein